MNTLTKEKMMTKSLFHNAATEIKLRSVAKKEHNALGRILKPNNSYLTYVGDILVGMFLGALLLIGLFA